MVTVFSHFGYSFTKLRCTSPKDEIAQLIVTVYIGVEPGKPALGIGDQEALIVTLDGLNPFVFSFSGSFYAVVAVFLKVGDEIGSPVHSVFNTAGKIG